MVPVMVWALYVGVGWAVAPGWCETPLLLHGTSVALALLAVVGVVLAVSALRNANDQESSTASFSISLGLKLGVLFLAGLGLAWILAGLWCP